MTGYRWYGVYELTRLERIRGLQHLGLSLRQIADMVDAPGAELRRVLADRLDTLRNEIATIAAAFAAAENRLATDSPILPHKATVSARHLQVRYLKVAHPSELAAACSPPPTALLTWLRGRPTGSFTAAVATDRGGEVLTLPARTVVRAIVPPACDLVRAGHDLFDWLRRHHLTLTGPTLEEHLVDATGASAIVLEVPVRPQPRRPRSHPPSPTPPGDHRAGPRPGAQYDW